MVCERSFEQQEAGSNSFFRAGALVPTLPTPAAGKPESCGGGVLSRDARARGQASQSVQLGDKKFSEFGRDAR